jgi:hypothetical protein
MEKCVTCGKELHPERAKKYNYCMSRECQEKNAKPLTMVAVGVNKAAEQYMILDDQTKEELASGKYHDQRRGFFGTPVRPTAPGQAPDNAPGNAHDNAPGNAPDNAPGKAPDNNPGEAPDTMPGNAPSSPAAPGQPRPASRVQPPRTTVRKPVRQPWSRSQQKLALLYNEQGMRPDEIAAKLGLSSYVVTQIILNSRSRGKL